MDEQVVEIKGGAPGAKQGFVPSHLAREALRETHAASLEYVATGLGEIRLAADLMDGPIAEQIGKEASQLQRLVRALVTGALAALVLAVGITALAPAPQAQAMAYPSRTRASAPLMEGPQPDPVARVVAPATVRVVLGASPVTARVRVTTPNVTPRGFHCASAWRQTGEAPGFLGRACSRYPSFTVPVALGRFTPLGRSILAVTDDVSPMNTTPARVALEVRRPSRFGLGTWTPTQYGDGLTVYASLYAYTPALGRWTPQQASPVKVQEFRAGRWVTIAAGTSNRSGVFLVTVIVGGGRHTLRVHRDAGATVAATDGTARDFYLTPTDVPIGVI